MEDLLTLRAGGSQSYVDMVEHLVQAVTGLTKWGRPEIMVASKFCEQVTISSELFTILCIENYKEKWDYKLDHFDEWKQNKAKDSNAMDGGNDRSHKKGTKKEDQFPNLVATKWTMYDRSQQTRKFCGWQQDGIARHNQLHRMVTDDRKKHLGWDGMFRQYFQNKQKDDGKIVSEDGKDFELPAAVNDLWSPDPFGIGGLQSADPVGIPYHAGTPAPDGIASNNLGQPNY
jgi:hypothetical protein